MSERPARSVGTQSYDAFGATRSQTGLQLPFTYTGEQVDAESGLVYLRNRYMDPATGRFLTPDPLGFAGSGVNLYAYAAIDPITGTDPSGLYTVYQDAMFECVAQGWSCQAMAQGIATDLMFGGSTEVNPFDPVSAIQNGSPVDQAVCAATFFAGGGEEEGGAAVARAAAEEAEPVVSPGANYVVYESRDAAANVVNYVGITSRRLETRAQEQMRDKGITITGIRGMENLTRDQARGVEQVLIEQYGIANSEAGTLLNKINSIAASNPRYDQLTDAGRNLLKKFGF